MSITKKKIKLSASKIKTFKTCSWVYNCQYILKIPQTTNLGASRGLCAHIVLECFLNKRHLYHYQQAHEDIITIPVKKVILKNCKKLNITDGRDIDLIESMIITACKYDFFCKKGDENSKVEAEHEFSIESENFIINGFIDKIAFYSKGRIKVVDYKTSKQKFSAEEIEANIQALMYSLAVYKKFKSIPDVEFLFLKFPRNPVQFFEKCSESQLLGFELYLNNVASYLSSFNGKKALSNLANGSIKTRWLCGKEGLKKDGTPNFMCQYRKPLEYYALEDLTTGDIIKTSFNKVDLDKEETDKLKISKKEYSGCPAFKEDLFDIS